MTISTTTAPIIETDEGPVQGKIVDDVVAYMGIPYAAPPLVDLRWKPPQPVKPWRDPLQSNDRAPACLQDRAMCIAVGGGDPDPMSEDCLYLNVWTPQHRTTEFAKLPVVVWIHGGAFVLGAGRLLTYHGANIVKRGAILVTLNYRMGALGFFAHPALDAEIPAGQPKVNNFGLLDQIKALEWVQRNISNFGGDPGNVTIFGQSAGARSVLALFASPLVKDRNPPLFHRGIAQSVYRSPEATRDQALKRGAKLAGLCLEIADGSTATADQLRHNITADKLMNINKEFDPKGTGNSPVAIAGDMVLDGQVIDSFVAGNVSPLPLIIGNTSDDGSVVLDQLKLEDKEPKAVVSVAQLAGITYPKRYYADLWDQAWPDQNELGRRLARDAFFTVTTHKIATAHGPRANTWRYYFDYTAVNLRPHVPNGTRHGDDVPFTMNSLDAAPPFPPIPLPLPAVPVPTPVEVTATDRAVADRISAYWFNFAKTGTPAPDTEWPKNEAGQDKTLLIGETVSVATNFMQQHHEDAQHENMEAFEKIGVKMDDIAAGQG